MAFLVSSASTCARIEKRSACPGRRRLSLERLEPRLLLSASAITLAADAGDAPAFQLGVSGGFPTQVTFRDESGVTVAVHYTGAGVADIYLSGGEQEGADIEQIEVTGSDAGSNLSIAAQGIEAETTLGETLIHGNFGSLDGTALVLNGNITVEGTLAALHLNGASEGFVVTAQGIGALTVNGATGTGGEAGIFAASLDIGDGGIQSISVTDADLAGDISTSGSLGNITVKGGDIAGSLFAPQGKIGNITVTAVAVFDVDQGFTVGGNLLSESIETGDVKGTSIGNITLVGGGFGGEGSSVAVTATGNIGNILVRKLKYKQSIEEVDVLDKSGDSVMASDGTTLTKKVTNYAFAGGGINAELETPGKIGNLTTSGGDLSGTIHAANGIGNVVVESILTRTSGAILGLSSVASEDDITSADLTATLAAEPGALAKAIGAISVLGGNLTGDIEATGKVGNILTQAVAVNDSGDISLTGGGFESSTFHATSVGNIRVLGGNLDADIVADESIGNVTVVAGNMNASLTALNSIGNVSVTAKTIDASIKKWRVGTGADAWWDWETHDGLIFGETMNVSITLGVGADGSLNAAASMKTITGTGVDVSVDGQVAGDPAAIVVKAVGVKYVSACDFDDELGKVLKEYSTPGGSVVNQLAQAATL